MTTITLLCEALMIIGTIIATSMNHWDKAIYFAVMAVYFTLQGGKQ